MIDRETIIGYLARINMHYEKAFQGLSKQEKEVLISDWLECLKEYPKELVDVAFMNCIKRSEFMPRIATIITEIEKMTGTTEKSAEKLWVEFENAVESAAYEVYKLKFTYIEADGKTTGDNARERIKAVYDGMNEMLKEYVGGVDGFIGYTELDIEGMSFEKGRFIKAVPRIKERIKVERSMPENLKQLVGGMALMIEEEK